MFVLLVTGAAKRVGLRGFYFGLEKPGGKCYFRQLMRSSCLEQIQSWVEF